MLPALPGELAHLWEWYCEVRRGERLTFGELKAWSQLTGRRLSPAQVDVIMRLDVEVRRELA